MDEEKDTLTEEEQGTSSEADPQPEETVTLTKAEHEKLLNREKEALAKEQEIKKLKGTKPPSPNLSEKPWLKDMYKSNEKLAISELTTPFADDPEEMREVKKEILANWDDIMQELPVSMSRETPADIKKGILKAYNNWKVEQGAKDKSLDRQLSELAHLTGKGGSTPSTEPPIKEIPRTTYGMESWKTKK